MVQMITRKKMFMSLPIIAKNVEGRRFPKIFQELNVFIYY